MPGQHEGHAPRFPGRQVDPGRQGGHGAVVVAGIPVRKRAAAAEFVPEVQERRAPSVVAPGGPVADGLRRRCQRHRTPLRGLPVHALRRHEQPAVPIARAVAVPVLAACPVRAVHADEIGDRAADRRRYGDRGPVGQHVPEDRHGQAAAVGVAGDERIEGLQPHVDRHGVVGQVDPTEGVGRVEGAPGETGQAVVGRGTTAGALVFEVFEGTLKQARNPVAAFGPGVQRERRRSPGVPAGYEPLGRTVHQFPVAQVASSAEGNGPRADAAQGQGDAREMILVVMVQHGPRHGHASLSVYPYSAR